MKKIEDIDVARKMINLQQSATSRNLEYNLTFETTKRLMSYTRCYYTNVEFNDTTNILSIDRVDPKKGYIEGNVVACTVEINSKKANLTIEEIHNLSAQIKKFGITEKEKIETNLETNLESIEIPKKRSRRKRIKTEVVENITGIDDNFFEQLD